MNAELIGEMAVGSKRHVTQIIKQGLVCSYCEAVKDDPELLIRAGVYVHGDGVALLRRLRGVQPVCGRKFDGAALQTRVSDFLMLIGRNVISHRSVSDSRNRQFTTQTRLIKLHGFGTVSIK